jgi:rRNA maturation endonuclease Nob1
MSVLGRIRAAIGGRNDDADMQYECKGCGRGLELQRQVCPQCGSGRIDRISFADEP